MIGIYFVCLVLFPLCVFIPIVRTNKKTTILNRSDSSIIKGIAVVFVILAHLTDSLGDVYDINVLKIFTVMGGMGVLLFFFLSGYGMYNSYADKRDIVGFWNKRLNNVIIPYLLMKICFGVGDILITKEVSVESFFGGFTEWFVVVIMLQYFVFFVSWKIFNKYKLENKIISVFVLSFILLCIFVVMDMNSRWYNGLMLFPFGMLFAHYEKRIIQYCQKNWLSKLIVNIIIFVVLGVVFITYKGCLWADFVKTMAGVWLSLVVMLFFARYELSSPIMKHIGSKSFYFYVIHIEIMQMLKYFSKVGEIASFYLVIIISFILVEIMSFMFKRVKLVSKRSDRARCKS